MNKAITQTLEMDPEYTLELFHQTLISELENIRTETELQEHPIFHVYKENLQRTLGSYELFFPQKTIRPSLKSHVRVVAWNIERGKAYDGVLQAMKNQPDLSQGDVFLLTEVDYGMARSGNRHVTQQLCKDLNCYGVYAPAYLNLTKGNGGEGIVSGENTVALQGNAILSRFPISHVEIIPLPNAKDHLNCPEKQIGQETAIIAKINTPACELHCVCVHLSAHSSRRQRVMQMNRVVQALSNRKGSIIIGGDWNTTTFNSHPPYRAILGFWRRVLMGIRHVVANHYPYPEKYFEKELFSLLEKHDFRVEEFNIPGGCTLHFDFNDDFVRRAVSDWLPSWCYPFVDWALKPRNGCCSLKLDWFAARNLKAKKALIVEDLPCGENRYSDHNSIIVDVTP